MTTETIEIRADDRRAASVSEWRLAMLAAIGFVVLVLIGAGLSLRYGEMIYFARVFAPLPGCL
jgi:hypothetical protein